MEKPTPIVESLAFTTPAAVRPKSSEGLEGKSLLLLHVQTENLEGHNNLKVVSSGLDKLLAQAWTWAFKAARRSENVRDSFAEWKFEKF